MLVDTINALMQAHPVESLIIMTGLLGIAVKALG